MFSRACLLLLAVMLASCGGMKEPVSQNKDRPERFEDAEAALDRAERDIQKALVLGGEDADRARDAEEEPGAPQAQPAPAPYADRSTKSAQERRCTTACRALASMDRATNKVCDLAGSEDSRCDGARTRLSAARDLVRRSCPTC